MRQEAISRRAVSVLAIMSILASALPIHAGTEIPIVVYILNAPPEVLSIVLRDDGPSPTTYVDPKTAFTIEVTCRDNNTAADIQSVRVILFSSRSQESASDSPSDHYTLIWTGQGGFQGDALDESACVAPTELDSAEATWRFRLTLEAEALAGGWKMSVEVQDEAESDQAIKAFIVNRYASASLTTDYLDFSGQPGGEAQTSVGISYEANYPLEVGVRSTTFVGVDDPSFTVPPEAFRVDDDPSSGQAESGREIIRLSGTRQVFAENLEGSGELTVYIFVDIPDPFLDQDYQGHLIFDVKGM